MSDDLLQKPVQFVKGVGPQRAELLARLDILTVQDLLFQLPRDVLDLTQVSAVPDLKDDGTVQTVRGRVVDLDARNVSRGRTMQAVLLECQGHYVRGLWFNQPWVMQRFQHNAFVLFSAKPKLSGKEKRTTGRWEMTHPRIQWLEEDDDQAHGGVLPRYGLTEGLSMHEMRRLVRQAVAEFADLVPDLLPVDFRESLKLPSLPDALRGLHSPATLEQYQQSRHRLVLQDLLEFQLGLALRRRAWRKEAHAPRLPISAKIDSRIRRLFPFPFTRGQDKAIQDICADLDSGWAMHRLLQADVGAGKTVVAIYAMLVAIADGHQAALMAPTELLARQHWHTIDRLLSQSRVERVLLTGQVSSRERAEILDRIRQGSLQLIVGTQSLIQEAVQFQKLGVVVIDEQHKFGVMQRAHFAARSQTVPHTLVMTATPIPRSLCLTQFGDLDLSLIEELPPGRQPIATHRVTAAGARNKMWEFIRNKLQQGRQVYVVCPRIEDAAASPSAASSAASQRLPWEAQSRIDSATPAAPEPRAPRGVEQVYRELLQHELRGFHVGLLHGQLDADVKSATMDAFRQGQLQALVSTSVIEVGVDVPNATLMVIYDAQRFGLAQLHQLRGRIGRGVFQGYCFLLSETADADAQTRLEALEKHSSGFEVAEVDFQLRGPGDVLGTRQHGDLPLRHADLVRDQDQLPLARQMAFELVQSGQFDQPPFAPLKIQVLDRFGQLFDLAGSG